jgi:hypothetical protein
MQRRELRLGGLNGEEPERSAEKAPASVHPGELPSVVASFTITEPPFHGRVRSHARLTIGRLLRVDGSWLTLFADDDRSGF